MKRTYQITLSEVLMKRIKIMAIVEDTTATNTIEYLLRLGLVVHNDVKKSKKKPAPEILKDI